MMRALFAPAPVAESVDAPDSKSGAGNSVPVRVGPGAPCFFHLAAGVELTRFASGMHGVLELDFGVFPRPHENRNDLARVAALRPNMLGGVSSYRSWGTACAS